MKTNKPIFIPQRHNKYMQAKIDHYFCYKQINEILTFPFRTSWVLILRQSKQ